VSSIKAKIIIAVAWILLVAALAAVYISAVEGKFSRENFYNADALYIPAICQDLFTGKNLSGWNPPAVPYFFPDMPFYFLVNFLVGNFHLAIVFFGIVQFLSLFIGFILISNQVFGPRQNIHFLILITGTVTGMLFATGDFSVLMPMFVSGHHFGTMLSLIFSLLLIVRLLRIGPESSAGGIANFGLLFLVSFLAIASDALYLVQFLVPALCCLWLLLLVGRISLRQLSLFYIVLIPAAPFGFWLNRVLLIYRPVRPSMKKTLAIISENFNQAKQGMVSGLTQGEWFPKKWLPVIVIIWISFILLILTLVILMLWRSMHRNSEPRLRSKGFTVIIFTIGVFGTVLPILAFKHGWIFWGTYVLTSTYLLMVSQKLSAQGPMEYSGKLFLFSYFLLMVVSTLGSLFVSGGFYPRYMLPALLFPLLFGWPFLLANSKRVMKVLDQLTLKIGIVLIMIFLLFWLGDFSQITRLSELGDYYPENIRCLDSYADYFHNGIAPYWRARPITMLSKKKILVVHAKPDLSINHWITNLSNYNNRFDFIILDGYFDFLQILAEFGKPAAIFVCENYKILTYNRSEDAAFQQQYQRLFDFSFTAAQLPSDTGRVVGSSRIADTVYGAKGCLAKSPDLNLWIGDYRFEITYFAAYRDDSPVGTWDIVSFPPGKKEIILQKGEIKPDANGVISGVASVRQPGRTAIRTFYQGKGILRIDTLRINLIK